MQKQNQEQQITSEFMNSLLGGILSGNPYINKIIKDPKLLYTVLDPNMNENDILEKINMLDNLITDIKQPKTPEQAKTSEQPIVPDAPRKPDVVRTIGSEICSELPVTRSELPVTRTLNFDIEQGLSLTLLKDAIFSMVLLTMEKDNIDWSGKRGSHLLPNAPGYNIVDASKRYYSGNRVEKIEQYVRENILKNEESFGLFLNKLYGQLIEE